MKKITYKGLGVVLVTFLSSSLLFGCGQVAQRPAQDVIRDGLKKFTDASSYAFVASVNGDFSNPQADGPKNVKLFFNAKGAFEGKDPKDLHMNLQLDPAVDADGNKVDGSFEVRLQKDMVYFFISKLNVAPDQAENPFKDYLSKWYNVQIPADFMKQLEEISAKNDSTQLTPQQKQIKDLYEKTQFLTNPVFVSADQVNGETSSHYKADVDKKVLVDFAKKVAEIQGTQTTEDDIAQLQAMLDKLSVSTVELWVSDSSGYLNQVHVNFQTQQDLPNQEKDSLTLKVTLSDFGKSVVVEAPKDSVLFPFLDFLLGGPSSSTMVPSGSSLQITPGDESTQLVPPTSSTKKK